MSFSAHRAFAHENQFAANNKRRFFLFLHKFSGFVELEKEFE